MFKCFKRKFFTVLNLKKERLIVSYSKVHKFVTGRVFETPVLQVGYNQEALSFLLVVNEKISLDLEIIF